MKTRETTPGKTYSVHTSSGCTISDKNGWSKTIDAPDGYFTAHAGEVTIDGDDAADVRELFKLAPQQRLALLGVLGGGVPAWFKTLETELTALLDGSKFELAWLAGEKKLVVHTDRISNELSDAVTSLLGRVLPQNVEVVRYNHNIDIPWRDLDPALPPELAGKYNECKTPEEIQAVDANYANDLTSDGRWLYPIESLEVSYAGYAENKWGHGLFVANKKLKKLWDKTTLKKLKIGGVTWHQDGGMFRNSGLIELPSELTLESLEVTQSLFLGTAITKIPSKVNLGKLHTAWSMFECSKLRHIEADLNLCSLNNGLGMFNNTQLDAESVPRITRSLPAYTSGSHPLTIGIHVDHQTDEEVLAAIANAESKGWTLTVQWNGTPTAQASATYGLRKPPIYARVSEMELPDGTVEHYLAWGHYVTDPTGYEEFRSVEAAREYYGLPDEPLTNN